MKKRTLLLLTSLVLSLSLFGCGNAEPEDDEDAYEEEDKKDKKDKTDEEKKVDEAIEELENKADEPKEEAENKTDELAKEPAKEIIGAVTEGPQESANDKFSTEQSENVVATETDNSFMVGTWVSDKIDATEAFLTGFRSSAAAYESYFNFDSFEVALMINFKEDGSYELSFEPETTTEALNSVINALKTGMGAYMEDQFATIAAAQGITLEALYQAYNVTDIESFILASTGQSLDELLDEQLEELDVTQLMNDAVYETGSYRVENNTLYIVMADGEEACSIDVANSSFEIPDNGNRGDSSFMFPMIFHKN